MSAIGFSIQSRTQMASDAQLAEFREFAVANISDAMNRTTGTYNLRPRHRGARLCGRALTVRTRPGDNLMVHKAIDLAGPGDVIVVDAGGVCTNAIIGEIMASLAARRGAAGFIIDGAIRDSDTIARDDFPVFSRGVAHRGPYKDGPGEINVTIAIDGMVVNPGDIIVGDADGLIAVTPSIAADLAALVRKIQSIEAALLADIAKGTAERSWVDQALKSKGVSTQ